RSDLWPVWLHLSSDQNSRNVANGRAAATPAVHRRGAGDGDAGRLRSARLRELCRRSDGVLRDVEQRPGRGATARRCGRLGRTHHWRGLYAARAAESFARPRSRNLPIRVGRECVAQAAVRAFVGRVAGVRVFPEIVDGKNQAERSRDCEHVERWKSKPAESTAVGCDRGAGANEMNYSSTILEMAVVALGLGLLL